MSDMDKPATHGDMLDLGAHMERLNKLTKLVFDDLMEKYDELADRVRKLEIELEEWEPVGAIVTPVVTFALDMVRDACREILADAPDERKSDLRLILEHIDRIEQRALKLK